MTPRAPRLAIATEPPPERPVKRPSMPPLAMTPRAPRLALVLALALALALAWLAAGAPSRDRCTLDRAGSHTVGGLAMSIAAQPGRRRRRRTVKDLALIVYRVHGALDDRSLVGILKSTFGIIDSSTRGRRKDLERAGRIVKVGATPDGRAVFDLAGLRRRPPSPAKQQDLF